MLAQSAMIVVFVLVEKIKLGISTMTAVLTPKEKSMEKTPKVSQ